MDPMEEDNKESIGDDENAPMIDQLRDAIA